MIPRSVHVGHLICIDERQTLDLSDNRLSGNVSFLSQLSYISTLRLVSPYESISRSLPPCEQTHITSCPYLLLPFSDERTEWKLLHRRPAFSRGKEKSRRNGPVEQSGAVQMRKLFDDIAQMSGQLPNFMNLLSLQFVNVSKNQFSGRVPRG